MKSIESAFELQNYQQITPRCATFAIAVMIVKVIGLVIIAGRFWKSYKIRKRLICHSNI